MSGGLHCGESAAVVRRRKKLRSCLLDPLNIFKNAPRVQAEGAVGVPDYLAAIGAPTPNVQFCPTGGVSLSSAPGYLALPNVSCVGGSWLTPKAAMESNDWEQITKLARQAAGLRRD
jgi:2-keto-3-deoxy-6-phosphogluconate aldolase